MAEKIIRGVGADLLGDGAGSGRAVDPGLAVIDHDEPVGIFSVRTGGGRLRTLEKVAQLHEFLGRGDIFGPGRMQDHDLPVACDLQGAVGFVFDLGELAKQGMNVVPLQIVRYGVLEDRGVGAQMRTGE